MNHELEPRLDNLHEWLAELFARIEREHEREYGDGRDERQTKEQPELSKNHI